MDWHILMIPLLGLTTSWRGVRIGGKMIGGVGGLGASNNPSVQAFDKAKAAGDREGMERAARQLNEQRMAQNRAKSNAGADAAEKELIGSMHAGVLKQYRTAVENGNTEAARQLLKQQAKANELAKSLKGRSIDTSTPSAESRIDSSRQRINRLSFGVDMQKKGVGSYLDGYKNEHPLNARILQVLPPKRNRYKVDKKLEEDFKQKAKGQSLDANSIRILAAMTPAEVIHHSGATGLAVEFSQYAQRSGNFWKDSRTGKSFNLGDAIRRELMEHDVSRDLLNLRTHTNPGGSPAGQANIWNAN